jgi:hypothetical protein
MRKLSTPVVGLVTNGSQVLGLPHFGLRVQPEGIDAEHAISSDGSQLGEGKPPTGPVQGPPSPGPKPEGMPASRPEVDDDMLLEVSVPLLDVVLPHEPAAS